MCLCPSFFLGSSRLLEGSVRGGQVGVRPALIGAILRHESENPDLRPSRKEPSIDETRAFALSVPRDALGGGGDLGWPGGGQRGRDASGFQSVGPPVRVGPEPVLFWGSAQGDRWCLLPFPRTNAALGPSRGGADGAPPLLRGAGPKSPPDPGPSSGSGRRAPGVPCRCRPPPGPPPRPGPHAGPAT